jgi:hypothetical protein
MSDRGGHGRFGRTVPRCEVRRAAIAGRGRRTAPRSRSARSAAGSTMHRYHGPDPVRLRATNVELDYRDLLSEGNEYYFHREYTTVRLNKYLQLRERILQQSHPTPVPISTTTAALVGQGLRRASALAGRDPVRFRRPWAVGSPNSEARPRVLGLVSDTFPAQFRQGGLFKTHLTAI